MKLWIILLIGLLVIAVVVAGYLGFRSTQVDPSLTATPPATVPVTRGSIQQTVTAPGLLEGTRQVRLEMGVGGRWPSSMYGLATGYNLAQSWPGWKRIAWRWRCKAPRPSWLKKRQI
jgi:hypothetical protein